MKTKFITSGIRVGFSKTFAILGNARAGALNLIGKNDGINGNKKWWRCTLDHLIWVYLIYILLIYINFFLFDDDDPTTQITTTSSTKRRIQHRAHKYRWHILRANEWVAWSNDKLIKICNGWDFDRGKNLWQKLSLAENWMCANAEIEWS